MTGANLCCRSRGCHLLPRYILSTTERKPLESRTEENFGIFLHDFQEQSRSFGGKYGKCTILYKIHMQKRHFKSCPKAAQKDSWLGSGLNLELPHLFLA